MTRGSILGITVALAAVALASAPLQAQTPRPGPASRAVPDSQVLLRPQAAPPLVTLLRAQRGTQQRQAPVVVPVIPMSAASPPPPAPVAATVINVTPVEVPRPVPTAAPTSLAAAASMTPVPDALPPAGAIARCKDGTYLTGGTPATDCANNGGLAVAFLKPRVPPAKQ